MRTTHYVSIGVAVALIGLIFIWGNTKPPKKKEGSEIAAAPMQHQAHPISFDSLLTASKNTLPAHAQEEVNISEEKIENSGSNTEKSKAYNELSKVWKEHQQPMIAAYYLLEAAKLDNSEKSLTFAAQLFLGMAEKATNESVQAWEAQQAIEGFRKAIALNANNEDAKVGLAQCLIGTGATMEGVLTLRDVAEKNPNNITANLILGQQGIVSGQLDKAAARFEKVLHIDPKNLEALLGLAEVSKNKGNNAKAIELLEQAKKVMNNPEFSKDIDQYISTFK